MAGYIEYKDSGIPWIGTIPSHWEIQRNKNCFSCEKNIVGLRSSEVQLLSLTTTGIKKKSFDDIGGKVPESYDTYQIVQKNDIVMCLFDLDCSAVFSGLSKYDGMISPAYKVIRCKDTILPGFADYWFRSVFVGRKFKYLAKNIRYSLTYEDFSALTLPLPSLSEQMAIVEYLDAVCADIDQVIAEAKGSIEEYKAWKASIIYEAVTKGLDPNAEMKDSGVEWIGNIPQLFHVCKIKTLAKRINVGVVIRPSEYFDENGTVPFLRGLNIKEFRISDENMIFTNDEFNAQLSKSIIHTDDVLIVRDGSIGTACVVPPKYDGANVVSLIIVTPNDNTSSQYLCYCLNSLVCKRQFDLTKIGSALTHTSVSAVSNILITIPSLEMQNEIVSHLDSQCGRIDLLINEKEALVTDLEAYKKSLIFEVVTGKRKVV